MQINFNYGNMFVIIKRMVNIYWRHSFSQFDHAFFCVAAGFSSPSSPHLVTKMREPETELPAYPGLADKLERKVDSCTRRSTPGEEVQLGSHRALQWHEPSQEQKTFYDGKQLTATNWMFCFTCCCLRAKFLSLMIALLIEDEILPSPRIL